MLKFDELRITPDNKYLIIDVSVQDDCYYKDIVIDSIVIDTQDTYVANGPSNNPIYRFEVGDNSTDLVLEDCNSISLGEGKNVRLVLNYKELNVPLDKTMFFVYAIASGTPAPETPCGMDNSILMGTVVNLYPFYKCTLGYLKELNNDCQVPKGFINMILRLKALELCIRTGNYPQAIKYWKRFFNETTSEIPTYNCRCNG